MFGIEESALALIVAGLTRYGYLWRGDTENKFVKEENNRVKTEKEVNGHIVLGIALLAGAGIWYLLKRDNDEDEESSSQASTSTNRKYFAKNHDHEKRQYRSRWEAVQVVNKMRKRGKDPNGTLNAYHNPNYDRWFVGNSSR